MAAKYRLTRKGANRLDVVMRYQAGLLGIELREGPLVSSSTAGVA